MKGVILAGGKGTRLQPLTFATNKHLLPVYDKPMIYYPIQTLVRAGITEIMIVTGGEHAGDFIKVLRNGHDFGIKHIEYAYQEDDVGGIADALNCARDFVDGGDMVVILGDNTTDADISQAIVDFIAGATIFLKDVPDPQRYGVPVFSPDDPPRIVMIEEKPESPESAYAVTGLYIYDPSVFDVIDSLRPSPRGQLEITDVNNRYIERSINFARSSLSWCLLEGFWSDAGTFESLFEANKFWAEKAKR